MKTKLTIQKGDLVDGRWKVMDKLGEGGCGKVYEVVNVKDERHYAMKVESTKSKRYNQLLKTEAMVLQKVQFSSHIPLFLCCDRTANFRFLIMELLGDSLSDFRKLMVRRRFSVSTTLRIGFQAFQAIWDLHKTYFVHRDIKPSNFAVGVFPNHRRVYLFDFGLSRSLLDPKSNTRRLRSSRCNIAFRGTVNYCSPNVHRGLEHGRHDDLWSLLYMCIEMIRGYLPWCHARRKKAAILKEQIEDKFLLMGSPKKFGVLLDYVRKLRYHHCPDYVAIRELLKSCIVARNIGEDDPFDWEVRNQVVEEEMSDRMRSTLLIPRDANRSETVKANLPHRTDVLSYQHFSTKSTLSSSTPSKSITSPTHFSSLHSSAKRRAKRKTHGDESRNSLTYSNKSDDDDDDDGDQEDDDYSNRADVYSSQIPRTIPMHMLSTPTLSLSSRPSSTNCSPADVVSSMTSISNFNALDVMTAHGPTVLSDIPSGFVENPTALSDSNGSVSTCRTRTVPAIKTD